MATVLGSKDIGQLHHCRTVFQIALFYSVPGAVLGSGDSEVNMTDRVLTLTELSS